ncbi:hypothetical protein V496_05565 [Pseudogymnoascus sp. VKM F-4515 (FW-2607)]|nr:hypothetical protein V496_05565 [Pseudogymnoascus sp. VKM F-4515 (FW-2607)]KFY77203.1 hypothetical protein V498_09394 [Pseudogymnoascus sp. VKM F-4517 (FW-2822)]
MPPHRPPSSASASATPSPSPSSRTCSPRSTSTDSHKSYNYPYKAPRGTYQPPSYEMAQITLRQRETELCKASKELELEKAAFFLEKADMQREKDEFQREKNGFAAATNENILEAKRKKEAEHQRQIKEMWEAIAIFSAIFLFIPAFPSCNVVGGGGSGRLENVHLGYRCGSR